MRAGADRRGRAVAARAGPRGRRALRRRVLDPLLVHRVRRGRHRHRLRRAGRRSAAHRRPATSRDGRRDPRRRGPPLPVGEVGEVCIRSGAVMARYWNDPEATAATLRDGWLRTGDLGLLDDSGCLTLAGRKKEMYIRGGYNVYPMEVEAVLGDHPGVAQVAIVPRPDPVMGEVGVAAVVPTACRRPGPGVPPRLRSTASGALQAPRGADRGVAAAHPDAEAGPPAPRRPRGPLSGRTPVPSWIRWRPGGTSRSTGAPATPR